VTTQQIEYSIETGKLSLSFWGKINHYGIVLYSFLLSSIPIFLHLKYFILGIHKQLKPFELLFLIPLILGLLFYWMQKNRLKFKSIETNLSREELNKLIEKVAKELEWKETTSNDKVYIAKTDPGFFSGSWGEQITILFDQNRVLANSICRLDQHSSVVSMGRNRQNIETLIDEIKNTNHNPEKW